MVNRVSTYYQNQNSLQAIQKNASALQNTTYQIVSGQKYQSLSDMGGVANQVLTLSSVQNRLNVYSENITSAQNTLNATEQALQDLTDLLTEATSLATQARNENSAETLASLAPEAQSLAESFYATYQTSYNGVYVFSGTNGQTSPISGSATATAFPGSPVPTDWYQGDSQQTQVLVGPNQTKSYGVTGDEDAFANLKAALESLWYGLENNDTTSIDSAIAALDEAKTGLTSLLGEVGGQMNAFTQMSDRYESQLTFTKDQLDTLKTADVTEALTLYSQQSSTLQASMMLISQINQLTLLDYI